MGNCAGIFSNCKGDDTIAGAQDGAVKKIDRTQMEKALAVNNQEINLNAVVSFGKGQNRGGSYPQAAWENQMLSDGNNKESGNRFA